MRTSPTCWWAWVPSGWPLRCGRRRPAPLEDLDPVSSTSLRSFIRTNSTVPDLPVLVALRAYPRVRIAGDRQDGVGLARALLARWRRSTPRTTSGSPCASTTRTTADWDWVKWLPHSLATAALGRRRPGADVRPDPRGARGHDRSRDAAAAPVPRRSQDHLDAAHLVVLVDGGLAGASQKLADESGLQGVTVIILDVDDDKPRPGGWPCGWCSTTARSGCGPRPGCA